jgi:predicted metal-dependent phosphoesterase TrpH
MLKTFRADLHIHTCLSPCCDLEMSPRGIAEEAKKKELQILGICDHNSAENVPAVMKAASRFQIQVIPGIEVTSQEEVHILALFADLESAFALQEVIYENLPGENDEEAFGLQVVVDDQGDVLGFNKRLLIGASTIRLEEVVERIHSLGGIAIASHIDREGFSLIGQLGFIPAHLGLDAVEISPRISFQAARERFRPREPLTTSSDAHFLRDIGQSYTPFSLEAATLGEIKKALLNLDGRRILN